MSSTASIKDSPGAALRQALSFKNFSALYIFIALFVIFAILTPETFLSLGGWRAMLDAQAITALVAVGALLPFVTGAFNLAVGAETGLACVVVAFFIVMVGVPIGLAVPLTILCGALVGLVQGVLITKVKIDSFIATLGMSSVLIAIASWLANSQQILGIPPEFRGLATGRLLGITYPFWILLAVGIIVWYVLERTPVGRRMYAAGYNPDGARLAGVAVDHLRVGALMAGGMITALAGVLLASRIGAGDTTVGPAYLLPALTAVFLGSTQLRAGRFNVWGTVIAVYVLAVGIRGLQLIGGPPWINELFNGLALLAAVGLSRWERTSRQTKAIRRTLSRKKGGTRAREPEKVGT